MSDNTTFADLDENEIPTSYSSATPSAATNRPAIKAPGAGTGRRKEAVARVRLVPGTRRTRATASLRRPVPAPGALIAGRFVAAAGDADV